MQFKNVLVLYKRSAYKIYFLDHRRSLGTMSNKILKKEKIHFQKAHDEHYFTLKVISRVLLTHGVRFFEAYRGRGIDYNKYDLIVTVGGDGTFLEASRHIKNQYILGVNSSLNFSVGRFCAANVNNFEKIFNQIVKSEFRTQLLHRVRLNITGHKKPIDALNDALICHKNPAFLCRYYIQFRGKVERQRSSGVWISTACGSTGAMHSAGGKILPKTRKELQYIPRELYQGKQSSFQLRGGIIKPTETFTVTSLMREGVIYVDGPHIGVPFGYAATLKASLSPYPIKTITV